MFYIILQKLRKQSEIILSIVIVQISGLLVRWIVIG